MEVIYSIGTNFAAHGQGTTAYYAARVLHKAGVLKRLICMAHKKTEIPEEIIQDVLPYGKQMEKIIRGFGKLTGSVNGYGFKDSIYDFLTLKHIDQCDIFHGWSAQALAGIKKAKQKGVKISVLERPNTHISYQKKILDEEYSRNGLKKTCIEDIEINRNINNYDLADFILVPSKFAYKSFQENGFDMEKIAILPYGYDETMFKPSSSHPDKFTVIYCGLLSFRKGVKYLLQAWNKLRLKDAELVLVGKVFTEMRRTIEYYCNQSTNIIVKDFIPYDGIPAEYKAANIFISPSLEDGFALTVLEAMGCGLPAIVTENTGAKDCIDNGVQGFIIPVRDADAIAEKIQYFYENRQRVEEMGRAAHERAKEFTWDRYGERLLRLYNKILAKN